MRFAETVLRIRTHTENIKNLSKMDLNNEIIFNALAMECFQTINSAIDLGEFVVSEKGLGFPSKYREIFEILYSKKIIDKKILECMKRLIFFRNVISHEYYRITKKELLKVIDLLDCVEQLTKSLKEYMKSSSKKFKSSNL